MGWEAVHPFLQEETSPEQNCNMGGVWSGRLCVLLMGEMDSGQTCNMGGEWDGRLCVLFK